MSTARPLKQIEASLPSALTLKGSRDPRGSENPMYDRSVHLFKIFFVGTLSKVNKNGVGLRLVRLLAALSAQVGPLGTY